MRVFTIVLYLILFPEFVFSQGFSSVPSASLPAVNKSTGTSWADINNDTYPDILISGVDDGGNFHTSIYINNQDETFTNAGFNLLPVSNASIAWEDFDKNGFVDLVILGTTETGNPSVRCYLNDGIQFIPGPTLVDLSNGSVATFDFNNDGRTDILINGVKSDLSRGTFLYESTTSGYLSRLHPFPNLSHGSLKPIDYNNDGLIDIVMTGISETGTRYTGIFKNTGGQFVEVNHGFTKVALSDLVVHDFNGDGFEDILYSGIDQASSPVTKFYINSGNGLFAEIIGHGLPQYSQGSLGVGDFNNDGLADILFNGRNASLDYESKIFVNNGDNTFFDMMAGITGIISGRIVTADFNLDNKLDLLVTGFSDLGSHTSLRKNLTATSNQIPNSPANLISQSKNTKVTLSFTAGNDSETPVAGLTYNIYMGTSSITQDIINGHSSLGGNRKLISSGNIHQSAAIVIDSLEEGEYFWSVQSIDNCFAGSVFAAGQSFVICHDFDLGPDETICKNDPVILNVISPGSNVNWYSTREGLLLANSFELSKSIFQKDTLVAEVNHPLGCVVRDSIVFDIYPLPEIDLGSDTAFCFQEIYNKDLSSYDSVNWFSTRNGVLTIDDPFIEYTVLERDTLVAEVFNTTRCVNYDSLIISVNPLPEPTLGNDSSLCVDTQLAFDLSQFDSVNWFSAKGLEIFNSFTYEYTSVTRDTIWTEVYDQFRCTGSDTIILDILELPSFNIGNDTSICMGQIFPLIIMNQDSVNWYWNPGGIVAENTFNYNYYVTEEKEIIGEAFNSSHCVNYDTIQVDILELPALSLGNDLEICLRDSLLLILTDYAEVNWFTFQTGNWLENSSEFRFQVKENDTIVTQVTDINGCINYDTLNIGALPLPEFSIPEESIICLRDTVEIEIPGYTEVEWNSNKLALILENDNQLKYPFIDNDTLIATVTNSFGCNARDTSLIIVKELPDLGIPDSISLCAEEVLEISIPDLSDVRWNSIVTNIDIHANTLVYSSNLTDKIFAEGTGINGCSNNDSIYVEIRSLPEFNLGPDTVICPETPIQLVVPKEFAAYNWGRSSSQDFKHTLDFLEVYPFQGENLWVEITNDMDCQLADTINISLFNKPQISAGSDTLLCFNGSIELGTDISNSEWTYNWQSNPNLSPDDLNKPNPLVNLTADEIFYLQIIDENGCTNQDSISVIVNPMITANAGNDREICFGDATILGVDEQSESFFPLVLTWTTEESLDDNFSRTPVATPSITTQYELMAQAGNCPADTDRVTVIVNPLPELTTSGDVSIGAGETTLLEIAGADHYYWEPFEGLSSDLVNNPAASPLVTTRYKITGTSNKGCEDFTHLTVFVSNEIFVPELFTPNNDGQNDSFLIYGSGIKEIHLEIYSTGGQLVFKSDDLNDITVSGWNGTHNGVEIETGNYIWKLTGSFYDNQEISFKGKKTGIIKLIR